MVETGGLWFCLYRVCIVGESSKDGVVFWSTILLNCGWGQYAPSFSLPCSLFARFCKKIGVWRNWIIS
jgi:hypothetical protein